MRVATLIRDKFGKFAKPARGLSSAGRAPALQAGGHRFDPDRLHQPSSPKVKTSVSRAFWLADLDRVAVLFDIVNGF